MQKIARLAVVIPLFLLLTGFSSTFNIVIDDISNGTPYFKLEKRKFFGGIQNHVELNNFRIVKKIQGAWDYRNPLWTFTLKPGDAIEIDRIQYGKTPDGFLETTKAMPLVAGVQYQAFGAAPGSSGATDFVIK